MLSNLLSLDTGNKGTEQPMHHSLISVFVINFLNSMRMMHAIYKFKLLSVAEQASLSVTWSQTQKIIVLIMMLI